MLIDLTLTCHRILTASFEQALVLRLGYGEVILTRPPPTLNAVETRQKMPPFSGGMSPDRHLLFQILPTGEPSFEDEDATGWDFSIHVTDKHHRSHQYFSAVLRKEPAGIWAVRYKDCSIASSLDLVIEDFDPTLEVNAPVVQVQDAWSRLTEDDT